MAEHFQHMSTGELKQMDGKYLNSIAVQSIKCGVSQVIAVPESPEDLMHGSNMPADKTVYFMSATMADGSNIELMMQEEEAELVGKSAQLYCMELLLRRLETEEYDNPPPPGYIQMLRLAVEALRLEFREDDSA